MGLSCLVVQLHQGSFAQGLGYIGVQLHNISVSVVQLLVIQLHGGSITRTPFITENAIFWT